MGEKQNIHNFTLFRVIQEYPTRPYQPKNNFQQRKNVSKQRWKQWVTGSGKHWSSVVWGENQLYYSTVALNGDV